MRMDQLLGFPERLRETFSLFSHDEIRRRSAKGLFAPVEQAWHIADLEVEGYGARIEQLLRADRPHFQDFKGDEIAAQRRYIELELEPALARFASARAANVARLRLTTAHTATQEGVIGPVTLERIAGMMSQHDASHAAEIVQLLRELGLQPSRELLEISGQEDPLQRTA
ncbi:MAG: DinB family protein [Thermoanaerobaculia bacterium]